MPDEEGLPRIGAPATDALEQRGVTRLDQVTGYSEAELLALHGVGPKAVRILREALAARGLGFSERPPPRVAPDVRRPR